MRNRALTDAPSRTIFAPLFKARWQNCQNIVNDSAIINLIPSGYKTYYTCFINQWLQWAQGFVPMLHQSDFFSTGMGYTVCDVYAQECMTGGFRLHSNDKDTKAFFEAWSEKNNLNSAFSRMFFQANAVGNCILVTTPIDGELYITPYPVNRVVFQIGRTGEISEIMILNRFIAGDTVYYARELRLKRDGKSYYKVSLAEGTLVTSPTWTGKEIEEVPECIKTQWDYNYGQIQPSKWYRLPQKLRNLGCYNVKNKSVAVALVDLPGYSDSSLHTALDVLYSIDYNYTQAQVDQYMGKSRTLVPKQMQGKKLINQEGTLVDGKSFQDCLEVYNAPLDDIFYTQIPDNNLNGDAIKPTFMQPSLRGDEHKFIRDGDLELLASKVRLSSSTLANHLNYKGSGTKTDDEINSENSTTENSVAEKRRLASDAINQMLKDVAYFYGYSEDIDIQWGKAGANSEKTNRELLNDYQAGTLTLREYLRKRWTDKSEEDILKLANEIETEQKAKQELFSFDDFNVGDDNG